VVHLAAGKQLGDAEISQLTGFSVSRVRAFLVRCRRDGVASLLEKPRGGRRNATMTLAEESEFLSHFIEPAQRAGVLVVHDVHEALNKRMGKMMALSTVYNLLHRHNWRKIVPRRFHPKRQTAAQDAFKKNFTAGDNARRTRR
jgi:transposase